MSGLANLLVASLSLLFITEVSQAGSLSLRFPKQDKTIDLKISAGWKGPAYTAWPSYETWSFAKKAAQTESYLQIRIDPLKPGELDWNLATNADITGTFDDFSNPEIERIAEVAIDNTRALVWAAYNVDGQLLMAKVRRGKLKISFELRAERRGELRRLEKEFLNVLKSVRIK